MVFRILPVSNSAVGLHMPHIIYSPDMEPITCVHLPHDSWLETLRRGGVRLKMQDSSECYVYLVDATVHNRPTQVLQTSNEELALKLPPAWLPGQQATINDYITTLQAAYNRLRRL